MSPSTTPTGSFTRLHSEFKVCHHGETPRSIFLFRWQLPAILRSNRKLLLILVHFVRFLILQAISLSSDLQTQTVGDKYSKHSSCNLLQVFKYRCNVGSIKSYMMYTTAVNTSHYEVSSIIRGNLGDEFL